MQEIFQEVSDIIDAGLNSVINDPDIVLLNIVALIVLALFVRKFFWSKITQFLDKQQEALTEALTEADQEREKAIALQQKATEEYQQMRQDTQALKETLTKQAKLEAEQLVAKANEDADKKVKLAEKQIAYELKQAEEEIKQSIKTIAFSAAKKIVGKELDEKTHQKLIDESIEEGLSNGS